MYHQIFLDFIVVVVALVLPKSKKVTICMLEPVHFQTPLS
jgi:hypothetical protein